VAPELRLRPDPGSLAALARRFGPVDGDAAIEREIVPAARRQGFLDKPQFLRLCEWKSPRIRPRCAANDALAIEEATRFALATASEPLRIGALTLLDGVAYPVASTILHWVHVDPYPILDRRALWSVGIDRPPGDGSYTFALWRDYTAFCRRLAGEVGLTMRDLDRALWQFAYESQSG
jgi:hypothetical protein